MDVKTNSVNNADRPRGSSEGGKAGAYAYLPTSIAAIKATNDLLERGVSLNRATGPFEDRGRSLGAGAIVIPGDPALANELANQYALDVFALEGPPAGATPIHKQRIVAYVDSGGLFLLDRFGFDYDTISWRDLNAGVDLTGYDVFVNNSVYLGYWRLDDTGRAALTNYFAAGGDYIGLGDYGAYLAWETNLLDFDIEFPPGNSIVHVDYNPADSVAAGFGEQGYVFVNYAAFFKDLGEGVEVTARIQDRPDFLVSGFWPDWQTSGANGAPVVIHGGQGTQDVTLIGFDPTFRAHPEDSFRMVANAIYSGLD
jgi:hypothetical protein